MSSDIAYVAWGMMIVFLSAVAGAHFDHKRKSRNSQADQLESLQKIVNNIGTDINQYNCPYCHKYESKHTPHEKCSKKAVAKSKKAAVKMLEELRGIQD